jgi:diamine N-acetyltransferase
MDPTAESSRQPIINIVGAKVALGPCRRDLLPLYLKWLNDFEVTGAYLGEVGPMTFEARAEWYNQVGKDPNVVEFTIFERATLRPIGKNNLDLDRTNRTATFGILIGEKDCWGKGYGTETARLMLDYGFTLLGLHNIMLSVDSYNERAIRAYRRAGFKEIGRRREARRRGDQVYDVIYMDCLSTEFQSPVLHSLLPNG